MASFKDFEFKRGDYRVYTPEMARYLAEAEGFDVRKEYMRMRNVAQDRLYKLAKKGFATYDIVASNVNRFPRLVEVGNDRQMLYDALAEVSRFLNMKQSTVGGMHETERAWKEKFDSHYDRPDLEESERIHNVNPALFGEVMRAIKSHANGKMYYSRWKETYRKVVASANKKGITEADLFQLVQNEQISIGPKGGLYDAATQRRIAGTWNKVGR